MGTLIIETSETQKLELEDEISRLVKETNGCSTHYEYSDMTIKAITYNPTTKEKFLLLQVAEDNEIKGLEKILDYVKNHKKTYYSHTVVWSNKKDMKTNSSYFYCPDAFEALEKFFYNKNKEDYIIYLVKLNSLA